MTTSLQPDLSYRVLIVDDEHVIADTLALIMRQAGYDATAAYDGRQALATARQFRPDCAISDVVMPDMDGIEMAIRITREFPRCRILLISGQAASSEIIGRARRDGHSFPLIAKPIQPQELLAKIAQLLAAK